MSTSQLKADSRSEFEAWFKREIIETPDFVFADFDEEEGEYIVHEDGDVELYLNIQAMFMAWTASRAAICIELPDYRGAETYQSAGFNEAIDECDNILRAAGITVKGDSDG